MAVGTRLLNIRKYYLGLHTCNFTPLYRKQKHAIRAIHFEDKRSDAKQLLTSINALNVYQSNIFQKLIFLFKTKLKLVPNMFQNFFNEKETK